MSRRTAPVFEDWNVYSSARRHAHGTSHPPPKTHQAASHQLFDALDHARFDQVRRAVAADRACLSAVSAPRTAPSHANSLTPVDYALNNCRTWTALLDHCRRTGIAVPHTGDLTLRERLAAMNLIVTWLLSQPDVIAPSHTPLHTAILCNFDSVAEKLLQNDPTLARSVDARRKTPLHIICALSGRLSTSQVVRFIELLVRAGANANARDADGRAPLHELVQSLSESAPAYGLMRRRRRGPTLASIVPTLDVLLMHGASLYAQDSRGATPMDFALTSGVDYLVFAERASILRERLCGSDCASRYRREREVVSGLWGLLPDDVVMRIFRLLSPRDVVAGIGATCVGLRRIAVSESLWRHLETYRCMAAVREGVIRASLENPPRI